MRTAVTGSWLPIGAGMPDVPVYDLEYNAADDVLVAGTLGRGVFTLSSAGDVLVCSTGLIGEQLEGTSPADVVRKRELRLG